MSYKNIESESFIPKQEIPRDIESNQIFSYELFEYRLKHQESEVISLKEDVNNKFDRLNSSILRIEQKFDTKCEKLDDKIVSNYNKLESRLYGILIAVVGFILVDILVRKGDSIIQFFSSNP